MKMLLFVLLSLFNSVCADECDCYAYDVEVKASYLYWGVQQDQMGYAVENITLTESLDNHNALLTHDPAWDSGVRLEGKIFSCNYPVNCHVAWTHFDTSSISSSADNEFEFPLLGITTTTAFNAEGSPYLFAETARSKWIVNINQYALDFEYEGWLGCDFALRPYLGVFGATIEQKQRINYAGVPFNDEILNFRTERKSEFWGAGPRLGLGTDWHFYDAFTFSTDLNAAFLFGQSKAKTNIDLPEELEFTFPKLGQTVYRARPMCSGSFALEWKNCWNEYLTYEISIGYEFQYWWRTWHTTSNYIDGLTNGEGHWGDMSLHGLVLSGGIIF